jgi:hypothetical protein
MKFFSNQTIANSTPPMVQNNTLVMPIRTRMIRNIGQPQQIPPQVAIPTEQVAKKVKWGEPTWFLFHTLSVKVKESDFQRIRIDLLNNIYGICINLPCPDCANHAKTYLDNINFNTIQTKEDLKRMLFVFHNEVNKRKGYPEFPYDKLDEKYSLAITTNIIRNFMVHFTDRNRSIKLLATDLHRIQLSESLKKWFNANIQCFDA